MTKFMDESVLVETARAIKESPSVMEAARVLGITKGAIDHRVREIKRRKILDGEEFSVAKLPSYQKEIGDIIAGKKRTFARRHKAQDSRDIIPVKVKIDGPIGILHMGDPHLDDDGCNIALVEKHLALPDKHEGVFRACVGDYLNNWKGRLAPLHAMQSTTQQEAYKLLEWFIDRPKWLYLLAGNHDRWLGDEDPLQWFTRGLGSVYEWHGARLQLLPPKGGVPQVIHCRHDFAGNSQYNRAHGATKAIRFGGTDDLYINGHKHIRAHYEEENSIGGWSHAVQLDSYKWVDDYPKQLGAKILRQGGACLTIHDFSAVSPPERVKLYWDPEEGIDYLKHKRRRK